MLAAGFAALVASLALFFTQVAALRYTSLTARATTTDTCAYLNAAPLVVHVGDSPTSILVGIVNTCLMLRPDLRALH